MNCPGHVSFPSRIRGGHAWNESSFVRVAMSSKRRKCSCFLIVQASNTLSGDGDDVERTIKPRTFKVVAFGVKFKLLYRALRRCLVASRKLTDIHNPVGVANIEKLIFYHRLLSSNFVSDAPTDPATS